MRTPGIQSEGPQTQGIPSEIVSITLLFSLNNNELFDSKRSLSVKRILKQRIFIKIVFEDGRNALKSY
jgi:hypothetical protein